MKLKELAEEVFKGKNIEIQSIGIYTEDEKGNPNPIYPEYADELLETHGELEVEDSFYSEKHQCLVVEFNKGETLPKIALK